MNKNRKGNVCSILFTKTVDLSMKFFRLSGTYIKPSQKSGIRNNNNPSNFDYQNSDSIHYLMFSIEYISRHSVSKETISSKKEKNSFNQSILSTKILNWETIVNRNKKQQSIHDYKQMETIHCTKLLGDLPITSGSIMWYPFDRSTYNLKSRNN